MRELYKAIDERDGKESVFLICDEVMYVAYTATHWDDPDCDLSGYISEPTDRNLMVDPVRIY